MYAIIFSYQPKHSKTKIFGLPLLLSWSKHIFKAVDQSTLIPPKITKINSFDIVESSFSSLENSFKGWLIPSQIAQGLRLGPLLFVKLWFQDYWSAAKNWNKLRIFEENDAEDGDVVFDNHSDRDDWRGDKVCRLLVPRQRRDNAPPAPRRHLIIDPCASAKHITSCKSQPSFFCSA